MVPDNPVGGQCFFGPSFLGRPAVAPGGLPAGNAKNGLLAGNRGLLGGNRGLLAGNGGLLAKNLGPEGYQNG